MTNTHRWTFLSLIGLGGALPLALILHAPPAAPAPAAAPAGQTGSAGQVASMASGASEPLRYIDDAAYSVEKLKALFPPAPATDSAYHRLETELVIAIQAEANDAARARAQSEDKVTPVVFADVLGPGFNAERFPKTIALLTLAGKESKVISERAKDIWDRPRPPKASGNKVKPIVENPKSGSYPSGHATRGMLWARLLTALAPDRADDLLARGRLIGYDRIVAGVHYPSDVAAGYVLGESLAQHMLSNPAFQADLQAAQAEWKAR
jgi:acid phosphatase (class A)